MYNIPRQPRPVRAIVLGVAAAVIAAAAAAPAAASPPSACAELGGTVDTNQVCDVHTAGQGYTVDFSFPVDYPDQQAVTDYVRKTQADVAGFAAERRPQDHPYESDAKATAYRSGSPTSGTTSLVFDVYTDLGGAHPVSNYQAFNYDLGKGAAITFDTLFKPGTNPVAVLDPIVRRDLEKHYKDYGRIDDNTLGARTYQNFALTDDAVVFFIGQGMWMPEVAGPREVSVPRAELASILA